MVGPSQSRLYRHVKIMNKIIVLNSVRLCEANSLEEYVINLPFQRWKLCSLST